MAAIDPQQLEAAIGPRAAYYLRRFEQIEAGRTVGWNWPAFFLSTAWFSYRGMGGWAALNFFAPWATMLLVVVAVGMFGSPVSPIMLLIVGYLAVFFVLVPMRADAWYYERIKRAIAHAADGGKPAPSTRPSSAVAVGLATAVLPAVVVVVGQAAWGDYTERAQVSEAISLMSGARFPAAEYFADKAKWPDNLKEVVENTRGRYTERVEITSGAGAASGVFTITATMKASGVRSQIAGKTVQTSSEDGKTWTCRRGAVNGMDPKFLPAACR